jgi:CDP-2,3-bis-(O-geranylgeranyl)-sn-glycerol synthase
MTSHDHLDPLAIAILIVMAFIVSGIFHVRWLHHPSSQPLNKPLDGGRTFRGKRILGDNKTVRGLIVIIPATGMSFLLISLLRPYLPTWFAEGIWELPPLTYATIGILAGIGFMAGELPNSFIKRQCGLPPGGKPRKLFWSVLTSITDRIDSVLGVLLMMSILVPVPWQTWFFLLILGPGVHSLFSFWLYRLRVKARAG